jgi:hypothetical protein
MLAYVRQFWGVAKRVDIVLTGRAILALHIHSVSHSPILPNVSYQMRLREGLGRGA